MEYTIRCVPWPSQAAQGVTVHTRDTYEEARDYAEGCANSFLKAEVFTETGRRIYTARGEPRT